MRIPEKRISLAVVAIVLVAGCGQLEPPEADGQPTANAGNASPNILFIMVDDMGLTDLGSFGGEIPTPNLDTLAIEGVRLTNFHVGPICMVTRAMLMSGLSNREAGVTAHNDPLRSDVASLPERLRALGYHTYMAGKWNLGLSREQSPAARGFESSFALMPPADNHLGHSNFADDFGAYLENGAPTSLPEAWYSSQLFTDKLISYIETNSGDGTPWFGYLALTAPHWPLQAQEDWIDRHAGRYDAGYDVVREARVRRARELGVLPHELSLEGYVGRAPRWEDLDASKRAGLARAMEIYATMTENMDMHIGRLLDYLRESGQFDNTVIVFTSDNGASGSDSTFAPRTMPRTDTNNSFANMGREWSYTAYGRGWAEAAMAPYRDVKGALHSGGTIAATFVHHSSVARQGGIEDTYLTVMDLLPTFVDIASGSAAGSRFEGRDVQVVRGRSFWPLVIGEAFGERSEAVPWMTVDHRRALVRWPWKVVTSQAQGPRPDGPLQWSLFDLESDPGERHDLSAEHPDLKAELIASWEDYGRHLESL